MVTPRAEREAFAYAREHHELSERRASNLVGVRRQVVRYRSSRADDGRCGSGSASRRRNVAGSGYRRLGYLLARRQTPNHKKPGRIYREENCGSAAVAVASRSWAPER